MLFLLLEELIVAVFPVCVFAPYITHSSSEENRFRIIYWYPNHTGNRLMNYTSNFVLEASGKFSFVSFYLIVHIYLDISSRLTFRVCQLYFGLVCTIYFADKVSFEWTSLYVIFGEQIKTNYLVSSFQFSLFVCRPIKSYDKLGTIDSYGNLRPLTAMVISDPLTANGH